MISAVTRSDADWITIDDDSQEKGTLQGRRFCQLNCTPITSRLKAIGNLVFAILACPIFIGWTILLFSGHLISCGSCCSDGSLTATRSALKDVPFELFQKILNIINPSAKSPPLMRITTDPETGFRLLRPISAYSMIDPVNALAHKLPHDNDSFTNRHVFARLAYLAEFLGGLPLRVADIAIGLLATPFALITCGIFPKLNGLLVWAGNRSVRLLGMLFISLGRGSLQGCNRKSLNSQKIRKNDGLISSSRYNPCKFIHPI